MRSPSRNWPTRVSQLLADQSTTRPSPGRDVDDDDDVTAYQAFPS
jgi:hypothetical protein